MQNQINAPPPFFATLLLKSTGYIRLVTLKRAQAVPQRCEIKAMEREYVSLVSDGE